jgi:hypothetical protein
MPLSTFNFQRLPQNQLLFRLFYWIQFVSSGAELGKVGTVLWYHVCALEGN